MNRIRSGELAVSLLRTLIACNVDVLPTSEAGSGPMAAKPGGPTTNMTEEGCRLTPGCLRDGDGQPYQDPQIGHVEEVGPIDYSIRDATGLFDPSPGAPGIYTGFSDSTCYTRVQRFPRQDSDQDGLTDSCEYALARAFAPMLNNSSRDGCFGGEPYWAAKYFDNFAPPDLPIQTGDFVRIAYMPGYYEDCGSLGHLGDSEFIQVTVAYYDVTKHWELLSGFLSAHTCVDDNNWCPFEQFASSQSFPLYNEFEYPGGRARTYPRVYISTNKHANYISDYACDHGGVFLGIAEDCAAHDKGRFMVWQSHNIGNVRHQLINCTPSQRTDANREVEECFWTGGNFGGWKADNTGPPGYVNFLHSFAYGCKWLAPGHYWCSRYGI